MKERPILFSGEMVRAILEGRKTQTRRIMKPQPPAGMRVDGCPWVKSGWALWDAKGCTCREIPFRYVFPGDSLWVRETWQAQTQSGKWWHEIKRDDRKLYNWAWTNPVRPAYDAMPPRWLPGIHMPRSASRITLEVVDVRVERVQEINNRDAKAEGVYPLMLDDGRVRYDDFRGMFANLWDRINDHDGQRWEDSPWVWVVEFKKV